MKLVDLSVKAFLEEVDSTKPAPGGGSVAALSSALGIGLISMVGKITTTKKKFQKFSKELQLEFYDVLNALEIMVKEMLHLVEADTEAFTEIMKAYQLPSDTIDQEKARKESIKKATEHAILIPIKVASLSLSAFHHMPFMTEHGLKTAISDLGVAALNLSTGVDGACMNALINLPGLEDPIAERQYKNQVDQIMEEAHQMRDEILEKVYEFLRS